MPGQAAIETSEARPIGFAVVGYGRIGRRHAALIGDHPEAALRAVVDVTAELPRGPKGFRSLEAMLADPVAADVDVVVIATPNGLHASQACAALDHGKHVIIEKPVALHSVDIQTVLERARQKDRWVFPVLQNRFAPGARWLKELVTTGRLGAPYLVQVDCFWNRDERYYLPGGWHGTPDLDGGVLYTQFSHFIDLLYWLWGEPSRVDAQWTGARRPKDTGLIRLAWPGGAVGSVNVTTAAWDRNMDSSITIIAEKGSVRVSGQYLEKISYCHVEGLTEIPGAPGVPVASGDHPGHRQMLATVIDALRGRPHMAVPPGDAAAVVALIEKMYRLCAE
ncbi:MAG TPA: Gfo/Idh/MocA family oxidoreductase [Dinghuibacter sp.]|uniref:Gfo/Idh/MocA family protein n=1 Tax=Dinghuibacter sp. TaxID=2024697 RepID=UPI002B72FE3E|nr:Gfo/Idh/MocA family oxidoreductase [Dinghuibacter sp.]HTJ12464.1 Gfo/Idh/MocA family oxidoreductase [Dinghuibacter sp.]